MSDRVPWANYLAWNARNASPGIMLDGEAIAAPAPRNVAPVASTEKALDTTDRLVTADDVVSVAFMLMTVTAKGKGSLSELDEFVGES